MSNQLSLFAHDRPPQYRDVERHEADAVRHEPYSRPCRPSCLWADSVEDGVCYLFAKPVIEGMCPSTVHFEWRDCACFD